MDHAPYGLRFKVLHETHTMEVLKEVRAGTVVWVFDNDEVTSIVLTPKGQRYQMKTADLRPFGKQREGYEQFLEHQHPALALAIPQHGTFCKVVRDHSEFHLRKFLPGMVFLWIDYFPAPGMTRVISCDNEVIMIPSDKLCDPQDNNLARERFMSRRRTEVGIVSLRTVLMPS